MKIHILSLSLVLISIFGCKRKADIDYNFPPPADKKSISNNSKLTELFAKNSSKNETFSINASSGGTISTAQGSNYTVPPNIFTKLDGTPVTGNVDVIIKEIFSPSQMILNDKPTATTTGEMLQSFGEFKVEAFQGKEPVILKPKTVINVNVALRDTTFFREVPMWNGDTVVQYTISGRDFENNDRNWELQQPLRRGISWSIAGDVASPSASRLNFAVDKIGTWRNCDVLFTMTTPTTVICYFTNVFNDSSATLNNMLFFKRRGENTIVKFSDIIVNPPAGKAGFLSYKNTFDVGLQGTFLAISSKGGKIYAQVKDVTIGSPISGKSFYGIDFNLQEVSENGLIGLINSLDTK